MSYSDRTIKLLCTKCEGRCSLSKCRARLAHGETFTGEIAHIRARNKKGPRYDPKLSLKERNDYPNLLLFCATCHKQVDSELEIYTTDLLQDIKDMQHRDGPPEITNEAVKQAEMLAKKYEMKGTAKASHAGVAIVIQGANSGSINVQTNSPKTAQPRYRPNTIGGDQLMFLYIEYLFKKAVDYWDGVPAMSAGRLGKKLKKPFKLGVKRTRYDLPVASFTKLCDYIIEELILPSPVGKRNLRLGHRSYDTFEEYRKKLID